MADFFAGASFPVGPGTPLASVIVMARSSIARLGLSESTVGQYEKVWRDLLEQCALVGEADYREDRIAAFVATAGRKRSAGEMAEWKWKVTRKASEALVEVADTGAFRWHKASPERPEMAGKPELDDVRHRYLDAVDADLSRCVLAAPAKRRRAASYVTASDAAVLVAGLDGGSLRDKAIVLLSARLGLRDSDIAGLTFDCIDWQLDEIRIVQYKTGEPLTLPLLPEVGNANMDYIEFERPRRGDGCPYVFLRPQAPYTRLTAVYEIVRKAQDVAGVKPIGGDCRGTHLLRRSLARRMLEAQVPMRAITDTLGYVGRESDKPYLSMDERMLRECALDLSAVGAPDWGCSRA